MGVGGWKNLSSLKPQIGSRATPQPLLQPKDPERSSRAALYRVVLVPGSCPLPHLCSHSSCLGLAAAVEEEAGPVPQHLWGPLSFSGGMCYNKVLLWIFSDIFTTALDDNRRNNLGLDPLQLDLHQHKGPAQIKLQDWDHNENTPMWNNDILKQHFKIPENVFYSTDLNLM